MNIPAGVRDGSRVRLAGKGEPGRTAARRATSTWSRASATSPVFKRKGDHLEVEVPLTIPEALRGATVEVPTLHGIKKLRVPRRHEARHGAAAARRGPAEARAAAGSGDIHYRFVIDVPETLNEEQQEAVDELRKVMNGDPRARLFAPARPRAATRGERA